MNKNRTKWNKSKMIRPNNEYKVSEDSIKFFK